MKYLPWALCLLLAMALGATWLDSRTVLAQKDQEIEALKNKNDQLAVESNLKLADAYSKLVKQTTEAGEQIQSIADATNERLRDANQKLQAANLPEIPLRVGFRKAMLGSGNVAIINSVSGQPFGFSAVISRPSSGQGRSYEITLDPGRTREIGDREGWAFVPGDTITMTQPGYKAKMFRAP